MKSFPRFGEMAQPLIALDADPEDSILTLSTQIITKYLYVTPVPGYLPPFLVSMGTADPQCTDEQAVKTP